MLRDGAGRKGEDNQGPQRDLAHSKLTGDSKPTGAPSITALEISATEFAKGYNASYKPRMCK